MTSSTLSTKRGYPNVKRDFILRKRVSPERNEDETAAEKENKAITVTPPAKREPWEVVKQDQSATLQCVSLHEKEIEWPDMHTIVTKYLERTNVHELEDALWFLHHEFQTNYHDMLVEKQREFLALRAHVKVFSVMLNHVDRKKIQEYGSFILMRATYKNPTLGNAISKGNGMKAIIVAMKMHPSQQSIQFFGLKTLQQLCYLKANSEMLVDKLDAVPFLVEIMTKRFSNDASIVEATADVFYRLCCVERLRKKLRSFKVVSALAIAIENFGGDGDARTATLDALNFLTMSWSLNTWICLWWLQEAKSL